MTRAFTLIELLVVVSVIGLLAGMLLPAINIVRGSAQSAQCANHLKQLGMGYRSYAGENNGLLPSMFASAGSTAATLWGNSFFNVLTHLGENLTSEPTYTKCPNGNVRSGNGDIYLGVTSNYGFNIWVPYWHSGSGALPSGKTFALMGQNISGGLWQGTSVILSQIPRQADSVMLVEVWGLGSTGLPGGIPYADVAQTAYQYPPARAVGSSPSAWPMYGWRLSHRLKTNVVCYDGHVELVGPTVDMAQFAADRTFSYANPGRLAGHY